MHNEDDPVAPESDERAEPRAKGAPSSDPLDPSEAVTATESSGVAAADEAQRRLADVEGAPLEEHVDIYEDVHRRLQEGLADLDER